MNTKARILAVALATACLITSAASGASAGQARFDLTGTWVGTIKCKGFAGGVKDPFTLAPTLFISQSGLNVGILADYGPNDPNRFDPYVGFANPGVKKPLEKGELAILACGTDDVLGEEPESLFTFDEIGRMTVSTKPPKVKATFKGTSIYSDPGRTETSAGTCKWKWTRTNDADPGVPVTCPSTLTAP